MGLVMACWLLAATAPAGAEAVSAAGSTVAVEKNEGLTAQQPGSVLQPLPQTEKVETFLEGNIYAQGGFGGLGARVTNIDNKAECLAGGSVGYLINHHFNIGFGGYGLTDGSFHRTLGGVERRLEMGYGGLNVGYTFAPNSLVHLSLQTLLGAGGIGYEYETDHWDKDHYEKSVQGDAFFVVEPMLYLELNMTKWFRLDLGGGYRYVDGVDENVVGVSSQTLRGANGELLLKFGWF
jgi:hypothetical protein